MSKDAFEVVVDALARRDLTAQELGQRLARAGFDATACADALRRAADAGYLDDRRVALERSRTLAGRGLADALIRAELVRRGLEPDDVDAALAAIEPEAERAGRLARRLGGGPRAARALLRKGYPEDVVERVVTAVVAE